MTSCENPRRDRLSIAWLFACLPMLTACGPGGSAVHAEVPDAVIGDAPWEAAFDPSERTEMIVGRAFRVVDPAASQSPPTPTPAEDVRFAPSPGAKIEVFTARPDGHGPLVPVTVGTADADGRFSLGPVPPRVNGCRAVVDGWIGAIIARGLRVPGTVNLELAAERHCGLRPTREIRGRVLGRDGKPAAGAHLTVDDMGFFAHVTTAADGTFSVRAPDDPVVVTLSDPAWDVVRTTVPAESRIAPGGPIELRSIPTDPLAGTVLTADDGRPVAGATVLWMDDSTIRTRSGPDGRYSLPVPRTGRIAAFGAGLTWKSYELLRAGEHEIRLRPSTGVRGRVVDADGKPVGQARLLGVTTNREGGRERVIGPLTAADGSFDFSWMPAAPRGAARPSFVVGWHRRLGASAAIHVPATTTAADAAPPLDLKLWGLRDVQCVVRDHLGAAVPGALVAAEWTADGVDPDDPGGFSVLGVPLRFEAISDATGSVRIPGAPRDRPVSVVVSLWGLDIRREVAAGGSSTLLEVALPAGQTLSGRVVNSSGSAVGAGGRVTARLLDVPGVQLMRSVPIGPGGEFRFTELPDGEYALEAEAEGYDLRGGGGSRPGHDDAVLRVEKSFRLALRVSFVGAPDASDASARLPVQIAIEDRESPSLPPKRLTLDPGPDGRVVPVGTCRPSAWTIRADADAWRGRAEFVHRDDGGEVTVDLRLERTLRFQGVVEDDDGSPLSGLPIVIVPLTKGPAGSAAAPISTWSTNGGAIDVAGLWPGTWEVRIVPKDRVPLAQRVEIPTDAKPTLRLQPHGELDVQVRTADGGPAPGALVSLHDTSGADVYAWGPDGSQLSSRFRTGPDGVVRLRGVPVGVVRCDVVVGSSRLPSQDVSVEARKTAVISVTVADKQH